MAGSKDTVFGYRTKHSCKTPHKYPTSGDTNLDILRDLTIKLYPTGRAWSMPENGNLRNMHDAINLSFARLIDSCRLSLDSFFPDNENFSSDDATLWEYRLGLITNHDLDLELRKSAIKRKMGYPGNTKTRQSLSWIENQLRLAGFDVYLHANSKPYKTPNEVASISVTTTQHGGVTQHGNSTQHGGISFDVIANSFGANENYSIGGDDNLWSTFFIGGLNFGDTASVPESRLKEFKELVLKLKPAHLVAFTLINYV